MSHLHESDISRLHPTQITVGMIEVADKMQQLAALDPWTRKEFIVAHPMPAVFGPDNKVYITDHHHLARALNDSGEIIGFFLIESDFSELAIDAFWPEMERNAWVHPVDENGQRLNYIDIPEHVADMRDDPYRSLAAYVRHAGGYEKTASPYADFLWADFFRKRITIGPTRADFDIAVKLALGSSHTPEAENLPGFSRFPLAPKPG